MSLPEVVDEEASEEGEAAFEAAVVAVVGLEGVVGLEVGEEAEVEAEATTPHLTKRRHERRCEVWDTYASKFTLQRGILETICVTSNLLYLFLHLFSKVVCMSCL